MRTNLTKKDLNIIITALAYLESELEDDEEGNKSELQQISHAIGAVCQIMHKRDSRRVRRGEA